MSGFRFHRWPTTSRFVTQHFGENPQYYAANFSLPGHEGIDIAAPEGSDVYCVAPGRVEHVFTDINLPYGVNVRVAHDDGYQTIYAHLKTPPLVKVGDQLQAGDVIGQAGRTGNSLGPHLHLALKKKGSAAPGYPNDIVDPEPFIRSLLDELPDDSRYLSDTVADGTSYAPGTLFVQTWTLMNDGTSTWGPGYEFAHVDGPQMSQVAVVPLPPAPPHAQVPVRVPFRAPNTPGRYKSFWQARNPAGAYFGPRVWLDITVPEPVSQPTQRQNFIQCQGTEFKRNGQTYRFLGFNLRGLLHYGYRSEDPLAHSQRSHQETQLRNVYQMGARVVRFFLAEKDAAPEEIERRLRELLALVKRQFPDLYLIPAFTNLYKDAPFYPKGDGDFYSNADGRDLLNREFFQTGYKNNYLPLVERIVTAFRDEPNIFAWEIGNELKLDRADKHNPNDPNPRIFINFNHVIAARIKALDPYHLVTTGMKSTHHAWLHTADLQNELYGSPNIDFITIHSYEGKYDIEGDRKVYEDAGVAQRLRKPFIVEEAGFDKDIHPDRPQSYREHMDKWYLAAACGYMPWGYIHTLAIGDGDASVGVGAEHSDFDRLCNLFRETAPVYALPALDRSRGIAPQPDEEALPERDQGFALWLRSLEEEMAENRRLAYRLLVAGAGALLLALLVVILARELPAVAIGLSIVLGVVGLGAILAYFQARSLGAIEKSLHAIAWLLTKRSR